MSTWVFAEELNGALNPGALELVTKARTFGDVNVFYLGAGSDEAFAALGEYGAAAVHQLDAGDTLPSAAAATAPAIANAIFDAVGIRITELPLTREKVLTALKAKEWKS